MTGLSGSRAAGGGGRPRQGPASTPAASSMPIPRYVSRRRATREITDHTVEAARVAFPSTSNVRGRLARAVG